MNISILQWNIWYKEKVEHIAEFLKTQDADIICLQEMTFNAEFQSVKDTPKYIAEQLGYHYYHKELPIDSTDGKHITIANGIFSRFEVTEKKFAWINQPKGRGGYDDEYRAYVEVTLGIDGRPLTVGTTHMSYTHRFKPTPNKQQETDLLVANLKKHTARFVFTGDLNALPGSYTITEIERLMRHADPDINAKTWTTKPFSYNGFEETELNWRLDYMFATKDMNVLASQILKTDYSDHLPVRTTFAL